MDITGGQTSVNKPEIEKDLKVNECACNRDIMEEEFKK